MTIFHSGRLWSEIWIVRRQSGIHLYFPDHSLQHRLVNVTGAQDHRIFPCQIHNSRFQSDPHSSSVQDHINSAGQIFRYMSGFRRAGSPGCIGTGRCNIPPSCLNKSLRNRMVGHTHRHCVKPSGGAIRHHLCLRKNHGKRSRPERIRQLYCGFRYLTGNLIQGRKLTNMDDQWIIRRSSLGCVNFGRCLFVQRIRSQAVHRLRGKRHQAALSNDPACPRHLRPVNPGSHIYHTCLHHPHHAAALLPSADPSPIPCDLLSPCSL